jgi:hypothetical protein
VKLRARKQGLNSPPPPLTKTYAIFVPFFARLSNGAISQSCLISTSILRNQLEKDSRSRQAEVGGDKGFQLEREGSRSWKVPLGKAGCQIKVADLA